MEELEQRLITLYQQNLREYAKLETRYSDKPTSDLARKMSETWGYCMGLKSAISETQNARNQPLPLQ